MNPTKIEWCTHTWNPVTGCLHGCKYCYARDVANRFPPSLETRYKGVFTHGACASGMPDPFIPVFYSYRLDEPAKRKKPARIFVCSMADLFGEWVPDEWIEQVFKACEAAPQHTYYFLTKNPDKYFSLSSESRLERKKMWFGFSSTCGLGYIQGYDSMPQGGNTFCSYEPATGPIGEINYGDGNPGWLIVGSETKGGRAINVPEREWILDIRKQCAELKIPLFEKNSLAGLNLPGGLIQEIPNEQT